MTNPTSNAPVTHSRCRCSTCGEVFSVVSNFDKHRKDGDCVDPASVGLELKIGASGSWWGMPGSYHERKGEVGTIYRTASAAKGRPGRLGQVSSKNGLVAGRESGMGRS